MQHRLIRVARCALLVAVAWAAAPRSAAADFLVDPFFAWSRNPPQSTADTGRWHFGGGVGAEWTSGSLIVGAEMGYAEGFFDPPVNAFDLIQTSHVLTASGMVGITRRYVAERRVYPFVSGGAGLLRQQARDRAGLVDITRNDPAWNIGAGARLMISDFLGVRGEARYFRDLKQPFEGTAAVTDLAPLAFWRLSVGAVIRFGE